MPNYSNTMDLIRENFLILFAIFHDTCLPCLPAGRAHPPTGGGRASRSIMV